MFIKSNGGHIYTLLARDEAFGFAVYPKFHNVKGYLVLILQFRIHSWNDAQVPKDGAPPRFKEAQVAYRGYSHTAMMFLSTGVKISSINALTPALLTHMILGETRKNFLVPNCILSNMSLHADAEADLTKALSNMVSDFIPTDLALTNTGMLMSVSEYEDWHGSIKTDKTKFKLIVSGGGGGPNDDDDQDDQDDDDENDEDDDDVYNGSDDSDPPDAPEESDPEPEYTPTAKVVQFGAKGD